MFNNALELCNRLVKKRSWVCSMNEQYEMGTDAHTHTLKMELKVFSQNKRRWEKCKVSKERVWQQMSNNEMKKPKKTHTNNNYNYIQRAQRKSA